MAVSAGYAALALAVGGTYQQYEAGQDQKAAMKEDRSISRAQALRDRQQQIRQSRMQRAQAVNQAYTQGGEGSVLSGAVSSIGSQLGSNLAFNQGTLGASERAAGFRSKAVSHTTAASGFNTAASMFGQFGSFPTGQGGGKAGASKDLDRLFDTRTDLF